MTITKQVDQIANEQGYRQLRVKKLQKRPSFIAKMHGYIDRLATYINDTGETVRILIAMRAKPTTKALDYIKANTYQNFKKPTVITCYDPSGKTVLEIPSVWEAIS